MDAPTISVVMPVFNARRFLSEAVESILAQTFGDFELIAVDDGSTDRSRRILERYAVRDGRVRVISRPNTGIVGALNDGLAAARGEFIARMDADDIALPDRFAQQVAFLRVNPEVVCVGGGYRAIDNWGHPIYTKIYPCDDETIQAKNLEGHTAFVHPSVLMRRGILQTVGGYDPAIPLAQDLDLWLRLGEHGKLANLPEVVIKYRLHPDSISQSRRAKQEAYARLASDRACERRGIPKRYYRNQVSGSSQSESMVNSRHKFHLKMGWVCHRNGVRRGMLLHGLRAIGYLPWRPASWRLIYHALLKPLPEPTG